MKTIRQQEDERRRAKLAHVRRKMADGSLVVRQMTREERARYPAAAPKPKRK